jgi:hypothetical protein
MLSGSSTRLMAFVTMASAFAVLLSFLAAYVLMKTFLKVSMTSLEGGL